MKKRNAISTASPARTQERIRTTSYTNERAKRMHGKRNASLLYTEWTHDQCEDILLYAILEED